MLRTLYHLQAHLDFCLPSSLAGLPWWYRGESVCLQCGRPGFHPWVGKIPWRRKWQPTPVFLPGESHGRRSLVGYSPRVAKSRTRLSDFTSLHFTSLRLWLLQGWQWLVPGVLCGPNRPLSLTCAAHPVSPSRP